MHKRNGRRKLAGNEKPVPDCVSDHRGDGDAKSDACRAGYRAVEKVGLTGEIRGRECHFRAEFRETVDEVNGELAVVVVPQVEPRKSADAPIAIKSPETPLKYCLFLKKSVIVASRTLMI